MLPNACGSGAKDSPILISDDDDDGYLLPVSTRTPRNSRRQQSIVTPTKHRLTIEAATPNPTFLAFMPVQAATPLSRSNRHPLTQFFGSSTRELSRQPSISSSLEPPSTSTSFARSPQMLSLKQLNNEGPIAPAPDSFEYRSPSPILRPDISEIGQSVSSAISTTEGDAGGRAEESLNAAGNMYVVSYPSGKSAPRAMAPDIVSRFRAVRSDTVSTSRATTTALHHDPGSRSNGLGRESMMPPSKRAPSTAQQSAPMAFDQSTETYHSAVQSMPPIASVSERQSSTGKRATPIYSEPGTPLRFEANGQKLPRNVVPAPMHQHQLPMVAQSALAANSRAVKLQLPKPPGDRFYAVVSASRGADTHTTQSSCPQSSFFQETSCKSCSRTFLGPATPTAPNHSVNHQLCSVCNKHTAMDNQITPASTGKRKRSPSPEAPVAVKQECPELLESENGDVSLTEQAGQSTASKTTTDWGKRLYTPSSMTQGGGYGLKSIADALITPEDEVRRRNARIRKAEYRKKMAEHRAKKETPTSAPMTSTAAALEGPDERRNITTGSRQRCELHGVVDCDSENCADAFFVPHDPIMDVADNIPPSQARSEPDVESVVPGAEPLAPYDCAEIKELRQLELQLALITRTRTMRRPYLGLNIDPSEYSREWTASEGHIILHVDFTKTEAEIVRSVMAKDEGRLPGMDVFQEIGHRALTTQWHGHFAPSTWPLPGREQEDVQNFVRDCYWAVQNDMTFPSTDRVIQLSQSAPYTPGLSSLRLLRQLGIGTPSARNRRHQTRLMETIVRDNMGPWRIFEEGSSDVVDISWSPDGRTFALCCCTHSDEYNKPGNLMLGLLARDQIRMLDGHKTLRMSQAPGLDPYLHSTVTSVTHSTDGKYLFSGSYDQTVKTWLGEDGDFIESLEVGSEVLRLAVSPLHDGVLAAGLLDGNVNILGINDGGGCHTRHVFAPSRKNLEAVAVSWHGRVRPDWLVVGYDNKRGHKIGDLVIFDARAMSTVGNIMPGATRQFDIFVHEQGDFVTGGVANSRTTDVQTQVRVWDFAERRPRPALGFDSQQEDINVVTMSPCQTYVTSSGTDRTTIVWDCRFPGKILHTLSHGPALPAGGGDDAGVNVALWTSGRDRFYTGASDGVIKLWDIRRGDPFVNNLATLDGHIMSAAFSPSFDSLMVGVSSGSATLFSPRGNRGVPPAEFNEYTDQVAGNGGGGGNGTGADSMSTAQVPINSGQ